MTFGIHAGAEACEDSPPGLLVRGPTCQPGTSCLCPGLLCARSCRMVYLEVVDPKGDNKAVAYITMGWSGAGREKFSYANSFFVDFGEVEDPIYKALLLSAALFINHRFKEGLASIA